MLVNMKGVAGPMVSIVMILALGLGVLFWIRGTTNIERTIVERSVEFISSVNRGEALIKNINEGIALLAQKAAAEKGEAGGGFSFWSKSTPTEDELAKALAEEIKNEINSYGSSRFSFSVDGNSASGLAAADISVLNHNKEPCGKPVDNFHSVCFKISGKYKFDLKNSALGAYLNMSNALDKLIGSSYFGMSDVGRKFFDEYDHNKFIESGYGGVAGLNGLDTVGSASISKGGCKAVPSDCAAYSYDSSSCDSLGTLEQEALKDTQFSKIKERIEGIMKKINEDIKNKYPYLIFGSEIEIVPFEPTYSFDMEQWKKDKKDVEGDWSCTPSHCVETSPETGRCIDCEPDSPVTGKKCTRTVRIDFTFSVNAKFKFKQADKFSVFPAAAESQDFPVLPNKTLKELSAIKPEEKTYDDYKNYLPIFKDKDGKYYAYGTGQADKFIFLGFDHDDPAKGYVLIKNGIDSADCTGNFYDGTSCKSIPSLVKLNRPFDYLNFIFDFKYSAKIKDGKVESEKLVPPIIIPSITCTKLLGEICVKDSINPDECCKEGTCQSTKITTNGIPTYKCV